MSDSPVISINNVSFSYNSEPIIQDASLTINEHEYVWVVGPNGGGKTTLVKLILGLLEPHSGSIRVFGERPAAARRRIGYMPQYASLDPTFPITVSEVTLMGRLGGRFRIGRYTAADREAAARALEQVELFDYRDEPISALSGGQHRRLLIARALAVEPDLLILDEPMANIDLRVEQELNKLLRRLNERLTIIMVSHDPAFVAGHVERVVCVKRHVHVHPTSHMNSEFIKDLYESPVRMVRHDVRGSDAGEEPS